MKTVTFEQLKQKNEQRAAASKTDRRITDKVNASLKESQVFGSLKTGLVIMALAATFGGDEKSEILDLVVCRDNIESILGELPAAVQGDVRTFLSAEASSPLTNADGTPVLSRAGRPLQKGLYRAFVELLAGEIAKNYHKSGKVLNVAAQTMGGNDRRVRVMFSGHEANAEWSDAIEYAQNQGSSPASNTASAASALAGLRGGVKK